MKAIGRKMLAWALSVLLVAGCCLVAGVPKDRVSAEISGDYTYFLQENGTAMIAGYNGSEEEVEIPRELGGYVVSLIDSYAFYNQSGITRVVIPDSVTSIETLAFYGCTGLVEVTIPDSMVYIAGSAFEGCTSLAEITIPNSVTDIGNSAFEDCTDLAEITLPNSDISIGQYAFRNTAYYNLQEHWDNGVLYLDNHLLEASQDLVGTYTVWPGTRTIASYAFSYCTGLTEVTLPDSVTSIGSSAFQSCTGLIKITLPDSVTNIGNWAFSYCTSLTEFTIPDSVTGIGHSAFYDCAGLTSIIIPASVTNIGFDVFSGCDDLTIYASIGSYAQTYADGNNITFFALEDLNQDGQINVLDTMTLVSAIIRYTTTPTMDFNADGLVDVLDVMTLARVAVDQ